MRGVNGKGASFSPPSNNAAAAALLPSWGLDGGVAASGAADRALVARDSGVAESARSDVDDTGCMLNDFSVRDMM